MQRPVLSPLQSRLLVYLVATASCLALWTCCAPRFLATAQALIISSDTNLIDTAVSHALADDDLARIQDAGSDRGESEGYEPEFGYLDRSLIGRQAVEAEQLVNNQKIEKDIDPENTVYFVLDKGQLRLTRAVEVAQDSLEARGTDNASGETTLGGLVHDQGEDGTAGTGIDGLDKRQSESTRVWLTANTCRQPMPNGNATEASKNHPQLVMYVSTSPENQKPGPSATDNTITNLTTGLFHSGYVNFEFDTTSDVYVGISAPKLEDDWFGSWHFEVAASTDGPFHNYNESDPFLYMIDTDSESTLFITYDLGDSNKTEDVEKWKEQNPLQMYAFAAGEFTPITGMERSYCALKEQFNVNNTRNFTIDTGITTKFGKYSGDHFPKARFHVRGLEAATMYNGFVVVEANEQASYIPGAGTTRGGGRVFQAFNWTTKADDSCQILFDLDFCDMVAYAVPSNKTFKFNDSALAEIYDNQARGYYTNFQNSLAQVACDTTSEAQYSLARTCTDCDRDYKNWLCMVLMPRCEDWTATEDYLQPRNINSTFANGSLPSRNDESLQFNETWPENVAFTSSRNPLIDEVIRPGPYKELKPCEDMCFDIVRSCPPQLGFGCPNGVQRDVSYGRKDEDPNRLTCSFPGAVVKLNARGAAGSLEVRAGSVLGIVAVVAVLLWV